MTLETILHEINNHLSVLSGYTELLLDVETDKDKIEKLIRMMSSSRKMEALILTASRAPNYSEVKDHEFGRKFKTKPARKACFIKR